MSKQDAAKAEALAKLRKYVKPGDTVYCILRHRSASGMSRIIAPMVMKKDGPRYLGWLAADVLGMKYDRDREGVRVNGCGMDMGFHLVYSLGMALWGYERPATASREAQHLHPVAARYVAKAEKKRNGEPETDGGYLLWSVWL